MKNNHHQGRIQMAVQKCGPLPLTVPIEIKLLLNVIKLSYKIYGKFIFYMYKGYEKKADILYCHTSIMATISTSL